MENVTNKVLAITGASSGIGEAAALMLSAQGAKIVLGARRPEKLQALTEKIKAAGGEATYIVTDVKQREDLVQLVQTAIDTYGRLDVLVSNAGIGPISAIDELRVEDWEEMIDINFRGLLYGVAAALPLFRKQGTGHFVNILSTAGIQIVPLMSVYAATKNAARTFSEVLRQEAGPKLRVTGISPGFIKTNFPDSMTNQEVKAKMTERMGDIAIPPEAIASAILYAISQPDNVDVGDIVVRPTAQG